MKKRIELGIIKESDVFADIGNTLCLRLIVKMCNGEEIYNTVTETSEIIKILSDAKVNSILKLIGMPVIIIIDDVNWTSEVIINKEAIL